MKKILVVAVCILGLTVGVAHAADATATPQAIVDTYNSLADTILGAKQTEWNLVHTILSTTYSHAEGVVGRAMSKLEAGKDASAEIETLAELVAQIGNEGDASVAAVRKRLLEGGHHHNAQGEEQGLFDEGFVIVTRASKKVFLDAASRIGRLGSSATKGALQKEWDKVSAEFRKMHAGAAMGH